ncbi:MAG: hypothetical protein ACFFDI_09610 [Promethearchaeota archaeon]
MDILEALINWQVLPEKPQVKLLICPDYLFFRQAPHSIHTEFRDFPRLTKSRLSSTSRHSTKLRCSLSHLFICDGNSALRTIDKVLPWINQLPISAVGCRIDFLNLPLLKPAISLHSEIDFEGNNYYDCELLSDIPFPITPVERNKLTSSSAILSSDENIRLKAVPRSLKNPIEQILSRGRIKAISDLYPLNFDILRLNIADFIEYSQFIDQNQLWISTCENRDEYREKITATIKRCINKLNPRIVLITFYKLVKFLIEGSGQPFNEEWDLNLLTQKLGFKNCQILVRKGLLSWVFKEDFEEYSDSKGYVVLWR